MTFSDNTDETNLFNGILNNDARITVDQALHYELAKFLEKRKDSGDTRPCGPQDMVSISSSTLQKAKQGLKDEGFGGPFAEIRD